MQACDAASKPVLRIEQGGVRIGDLLREREYVRRERPFALPDWRASSRCSTAHRVHTDQCPSNPPAKCSFRPPKSNSVSRSTRMLSSLPVYSAISLPDSATARTTSSVW